MLAAERKPLNDSRPSEELAKTGATGAATGGTTGSTKTGGWRGATCPRKEPTKVIVSTGPTGAATGPQDEYPKEGDTKPIDPKLLGTGATGAAGMFDALFWWPRYFKSSPQLIIIILIHESNLS